MNTNSSVIKSLLFTAHALCLLSSIAAVTVHVYGLQFAAPNTLEHTFYIVSSILSAFLALLIIFGYYGLVCENLGANIIFASLLLLLFILQAQEMRAFQPEIFETEAREHLERTWNVVTVQPNYMQSLEMQYQCCALNGAEDYQHRNISLSRNCIFYSRGCLKALHISYNNTKQREFYSNWTIMTVELFTYALTVAFCVLINKRPYQAHIAIEPVQIDIGPRLNHVDSRTHLLSS